MADLWIVVGGGERGSLRAWLVGEIHTLVIVYYIAQVVSAAVVGLAHAHGVVRKVDIAIVACGKGWLVMMLARRREARDRGGRPTKDCRRGVSMQSRIDDEQK